MGHAFVCPGAPIKLDSLGKTISINPLLNCKLQYTTDIGNKIELKCTDFRVGTTPCSATGNRAVIDGTTYCGTKTNWAVVSKANKMDIDIIATGTGRLICAIKAIVDPCNCGRRKLVRLMP